MTSQSKLYNMPKSAYTSEDWFLEEKKTIFSKTWQFAGFVEDLDEADSHICLNIGSSHIIIVKDDKGQINAIHRACRHRGNDIQLVHGKNKSMFKCPYHNWTYDLNGKVLGMPEASDLEVHSKDDLGLRRGSVAIWKTMIFVHADSNPPSFESYIGGLSDKMGPHRPDLLEEYRDTNQSYLVHCNWKLFAENYMDGYHLKYLHSETLFMYDHDKQNAQFVGDHWTFYEPITADYAKDLYQYGYQPIDHVPPSKLGAYVHLVFPNLGISESESSWSVLQMIPLKPDLTLLQYRSKIMPTGKKNGFSAFFKQKTSSDNKPIEVSDFDQPLTCGDFMIEDMVVCESIQRNLSSEKFSVGPLHTEKEDAISQFQKAIYRNMMKSPK